MSSFTSGQSVALAITPKISSFLSIVSSTWIVVEVMTQPLKRQNTYNRLLLMMSVCDLLTTIWFFMSTWPVPPYTTPQVAFAVGNETTCTTQGFFLQAGIWSPIYNCCLAFYYWLAVKYYSVPSVNDEQTLRRIEYGMHAVPLLFGIGTAIAGVFLKLYNNANLWCWIAPQQQQQQQETCGDSSSSSSCQGGDDNNALIYRWAFYFGPLWLCIVVATVVMVLVYMTVRRKELSHLSMVKSTRNSMIAAQEAASMDTTEDKDSENRISTNNVTTKKKKPTHTRYRSFAPVVTAAAAAQTTATDDSKIMKKTSVASTITTSGTIVDVGVRRAGGGKNDTRHGDNRTSSVAFQEEEQAQSGASQTNNNSNLVMYGASQYNQQQQQRQHIRRESRQMNDFFRAMTDVDLFDAVDDTESSKILKAIVTGSSSSHHHDVNDGNTKKDDRQMDGNDDDDDDDDGDETEYVLQTIGTYISANEQASSSEMGSFGSRAVFRQSLYYTLGFYMTFLFATVNRILQQATGKTYFPIILLHSFFIPLQGLFNLLVYRYYFFNRLRQRNPHMHFGELLSHTFRWTFLGPKQEKECRGGEKRTISGDAPDSRSQGNNSASVRSTSTWDTVSRRISSLSNLLSPRQSEKQGQSIRGVINATTPESLKSTMRDDQVMTGLDSNRMDQSELPQDQDVVNFLFDDVMGSYNNTGLDDVVNLPQIDEDDGFYGQMTAVGSGNSSMQHHENQVSGRQQPISADNYPPAVTQFPIFVKGDSFRGQTTPGFENNLEFLPHHRYSNTIESTAVEYTKEKVDDEIDDDVKK